MQTGVWYLDPLLKLGENGKQGGFREWLYWPGDAGVQGNDRADKLDWRAKRPSQVACASEGQKCLETGDTSWGLSAKGTPSHHPPPKGDLYPKKWKKKKRSPIYLECPRMGQRQSDLTLELVSKATSGKLPRDGVKRMWALPSAYIPPWNWSEDGNHWATAASLSPRLQCQWSETGCLQR